MLENLRRLLRRPTAPDPLPGLFSDEALRRAWAQVRTNKGAPGVDGVTIRTFEQTLDEHLGKLQEELVAGTYTPRPVKRILVPKASGGLRPIGIWTLRDRVAQRVIHDYLEPIFEPRFLGCSFGFRPGLSIHDAVARVEQHRNANRRWIVDADIKDCFNSIDSSILMRLVRRRVRHYQVTGLIEKWLKARIFNSVDGEPKQAGVSQGSVLAPLLSNVYLHEFDTAVMQDDLHLVRFADDWIICCRRKQDAQHALTRAGRHLQQLKLTIHPRKTQIVHFDDGFKFLGHFFVRHEIYRL